MAEAKKAEEAEVPTKEKENKEKDICFVIMPFEGWNKTYYTEIYAKAIEKAGLHPVRVDDLFRPGNIVEDIWNFTKNAKIILADLTGKNPNVFYELGLAHAITKPVILLTEDVDDIPFDLRALRHIAYDKNDPAWGKEIEEKIVKAIKEVLKDPKKSILSTFLEIKSEDKGKAVSKYEKDILSLRQDIDTLKNEIKPIEKKITHGTPDFYNPSLEILKMKKIFEEFYKENEISRVAIQKFIEDNKAQLAAFNKAFINKKNT